MGTDCYAMVRGSGLRVTGLDRRGRPLSPTQFATSKAVAKVTINEAVEQGANEVLSTPEDERRIHLVRHVETIRYRVDIEFLRVDPGVFSLVAGVPLVQGADESLGFGEGAFGEMPFGSGTGEGSADVTGFDSGTRNTPAPFALEVWSKLAGQHCADGQQAWGYTLFPYLRGGRLGGFRFANGLVSFTLIGAQTRRGPRWGVGPHDLEGPFERLTDQVSRNTTWRTFKSPAAPPVEVCGVQETTDVLDNGTAANPMPDPDALLFVDGERAYTSAWIIDGGRA